MVHIKRVELSQFKSFGGTTQIPLLPGFTVVSGPNGSGKSNILDALLFCLGLASSRGMRAERLPDLVNHNKEHRGTVEASVTVTFDLADAPDALFEDEDQVPNGTGEQGSGGAGEQENSKSTVHPEFEGNGTVRAGLNGNLAEEQTPSQSAHKFEKNGTVGAGLADNLAGEQTISHQNQPSTAKEKPTANSQQPKSLEWSVTRRLRVTKQGTYTSNYYINGESCTQTELHEQLNRLRIYPEGYNVVLQGDVTSIISMNSRERREIIDELAGVAAFDRKIVQTKQTLDAVKEREDSCRIIEKELVAQRDRLAADRIKAEKYQKLRAELQEKQQREAILQWRSRQRQELHLKAQIAADELEAAQLTAELAALATQINQATAQLEQLNARVKALGEDEQLAVASTLATQQAELRQLERQQEELAANLQQTNANLQTTKAQIQSHEQTLHQLTEEKHLVETRHVAALRTRRDEAQAALNQSREQANAIASASETWVQQQTALNRQIETLLQTLDPQRTLAAQLQERQSQLNRQIEVQNELQQALEPEIATKQAQLADLETQSATSTQQIQALAQSLAAAEQALQVQQQTQARLLSEQRDKQRQLDKLEAQAQAQQEAQGTYATKVILQTGMPGLCGLVAQLGRVEPRFQLALETAAGGRLGNLVVEDDGVAAAGIELLKQKRAGRVTFLPLNKIQAPRLSATIALRYAQGFVDYAVNLIDCDPRYRTIFLYVFGSTVVFESLSVARSYLGQYRIVTLDGELLESSGAMTGGSNSQRSGLHFGTSDAMESSEVMTLRTRLQDIEQMLDRCGELIHQASAAVRTLTQELTEARATRSETQLRLEQLHKEIQSLTAQQEQMRSQLVKNTQELTSAAERLQTLTVELATKEAQLQEFRRQLAQLEASQTHSEWQQIQGIIKGWEAQLSACEQELRAAEKQLQDLDNQAQRTAEKITEGHQRVEAEQTQQRSLAAQQSALRAELRAKGEQITQTQGSLSQIEQKLGEVKQERDRAQKHLQDQERHQQERSWQQQKLQETQATQREALATLQAQLQLQHAELLASWSEAIDLINAQSEDAIAPHAFDFAAQLEQLQTEIRNSQKRLQAMEPVNMLALEEYDRTTTRLSELSEKLTTLEAERTELLLRVENFTTLRFRAFKEAFDAINVNFQTIFASLSDGDGYLQLEDPEDSFNGGLNLVAHPKGKPVQRLASMSGGEKSLTALSFIFALQRYRPSPFYAFDEVDMFLDGANVERLARMIKQQATLAQFIVVSLRRPMIESSERTIGVTQARGAYTQVLGIKLPPKSAIR